MSLVRVCCCGVFAPQSSPARQSHLCLPLVQIDQFSLSILSLQYFFYVAQAQKRSGRTGSVQTLQGNSVYCNYIIITSYWQKVERAMIYENEVVRVLLRLCPGSV